MKQKSPGKNPGEACHIQTPCKKESFTFLLSSRLYCWYRIKPVQPQSKHLAGRRLIGNAASLPVGNRTQPRRTSLYNCQCLEWFGITDLRYLCLSVLSIVPSYCCLPIFMVRPIRFLGTSTVSTCTSTISPTLTASKGCLIKRSVIWEI